MTHLSKRNFIVAAALLSMALASSAWGDNICGPNKVLVSGECCDDGSDAIYCPRPSNPGISLGCGRGYLWRPGDGCVKSDAGGGLAQDECVMGEPGLVCEPGWTVTNDMCWKDGEIPKKPTRIPSCQGLPYTVGKGFKCEPIEDKIYLELTPTGPIGQCTVDGMHWFSALENHACWQPCPPGYALLAYPGTWTLVCARDLQAPK